MQRTPDQENVKRAREQHGPAREAFLTRRVDHKGVMNFGPYDCRVCWNSINNGDNIVETGYALMHAECHAALMEGRNNY